MTLARLAACSTLLTAVLWTGCAPSGTGGVNAPETLQKPYVVLVSFDGFRHDYLERYNTPNFDRVAADGVTADALIPVYPSLTFPAHYSIATGLYPEHHGLIGNKFYDPARAALYDYRDNATVQDGTWYGGEPIWVTAETQGMVAGAMLFVGTEAGRRRRVPDVLDAVCRAGIASRTGRCSPRLAVVLARPPAAPGHPVLLGGRWCRPPRRPGVAGRRRGGPAGRHGPRPSARRHRRPAPRRGDLHRARVGSRDGGYRCGRCRQPR